MSRRIAGTLSCILLAFQGCGKRADPLPPWVKTPQPPTGLEVAQSGDEIEIRLTAPRLTTENRPLPVIEIELLEGPPSGDFGKLAKPIFREEVAPGEARTRRLPRPAGEVRISARAFSGGARSSNVAPVAYKPAPVPLPPTALEVTNTATGVTLAWVNPVGAEPWPMPSPSPSVSPSPATSPSSITTPAASPALTPTPAPTPTPALGPPPGPPPNLPSAASPTEPPTPDSLKPVAGAPPPTTGVPPSPVPSPGSPTAPTPLATGLRIFRTDGTTRLATEPLRASSWIDTSVKAGEKPCYALRYFTSLKPLVESVPTQPVCIDVVDLVPPEPPTRVGADLGDGFVEISWTASVSDDVAFYRVFRTLAGGPRILVVSTDGPIVRVRDTDSTPGPRTYEVLAVDRAGLESAPQPAVRINVP